MYDRLMRMVRNFRCCKCRKKDLQRNMRDDNAPFETHMFRKINCLIARFYCFRIEPMYKSVDISLSSHDWIGEIETCFYWLLFWWYLQTTTFITLRFDLMYLNMLILEEEQYTTFITYLLWSLNILKAFFLCFVQT